MNTKVSVTRKFDMIVEYTDATDWFRKIMMVQGQVMARLSTPARISVNLNKKNANQKECSYSNLQESFSSAQDKKYCSDML
jgi:hypothetical protein